LIIGDGSGQINIPADGGGSYECTVPVENGGHAALDLRLDKAAKPQILHYTGPQHIALQPFAPPYELNFTIDSGALAGLSPKCCVLTYTSTDPRRPKGKILFCLQDQAGAVGLENTSVDLSDCRIDPLPDGKRREYPAIFHASNSGSIPYKIEIVEDRDNHLRVELDHDGPLWLLGYEENVEIPLRVWSEVEGEHEKEPVILRFLPYGGQAKTQNMRVQLSARCFKGAQPSVEKLDLGSLVPGQVKLATLEISNLGGAPFAILECAADPFLQCLTTMPLQQPIAPKGSRRLEFHLDTRRIAVDLKEGEKQTRRGFITLKTDVAEIPSIQVPWVLSLFSPVVDEQLVFSVDFGTANSCVAAYRGESGIRPQIVYEDDATGGIMPSAVAFFTEHDDLFVVGKYAIEQQFNAKAVIVQNIKRCFDRGPQTINGKTYEPIELASRIIQQLLLEACRQFNKMPKTIAMTLPAAFWGYRRNSMIEACDHACEQALGRKATIHAVDEPTAAAVHFLFYGDHELQQLPTTAKWRVLVFDFGGGTLDICIVEFSHKPDGGVIIEPLIARGDNYMGGIDIDVVLLKYMAAIAAKNISELDVRALSLDLNEYERRYASKAGGWVLSRFKWYEASRRAKEALSDKEAAGFEVDFVVGRDGKQLSTRFSSTVTREMFNAAIDERVKQAEHLVKDILAHCELQACDIDHVLLTGQSSRIVKYQEMMKALFGGKVYLPRDVFELKTSVASGAALVAHRQRISPDDHFQIRNLHRTAYRFGAALAVGHNRRRFIEMIPSGAVLETACGSYTHTVGLGAAYRVELVQNGTKRDEYAEHENLDISCVGILDLSTLPPGPHDIAMHFKGEYEGQLSVTVDGAPWKLLTEQRGEGSYI
jgi:molecular chaperone DnaK (HSP70)